MNADIPVAILAVALFVGYTWLLTRATVPLVTVLSFASNNEPRLYAALLAVLAGLPGCLLALPRAFAPPPPPVQPRVRQRRQLAARRRSYVRTDVLGIAAMLLAQVPLPAPWGPEGKRATIANVTKSAEIVVLSNTFALTSFVIFGVGLLAALLVKVYSHAAAWRVVGIVLALGAPVVGWFWAVRPY